MPLAPSAKGLPALRGHRGRPLSFPPERCFMLMEPLLAHVAGPRVARTPGAWQQASVPALWPESWAPNLSLHHRAQVFRRPPPPQHPHSGLQGTSSRRPDLLLSVSSRAPGGHGLGQRAGRPYRAGAGAESWHRAARSHTFRKGALRLVLSTQSMTAHEDKCQRPPSKDGGQQSGVYSS